VVQWGEESPAVQHAAPQMRAAHVERHGPLAQPSPGRQSGGRVVGSSAQQPDSAKKRRPVSQLALRCGPPSPVRPMAGLMPHPAVLRPTSPGTHALSPPRKPTTAL
jgi:hypothetical protein